MSTEVKVPVLPESVADARVAAWHKKPGEAVHRDENLVDLETDKVVLEVPSPVDGVLKEITTASGETVTSGEVLGVRQAGMPQMRIADLEAHADLLAVARDDAKLIMDRDPELTSDRGQALRVLLYLFERDAAVPLLRSG